MKLITPGMFTTEGDRLQITIYAYWQMAYSCPGIFPLDIFTGKYCREVKVNPMKLAEISYPGIPGKSQCSKPQYC